MRGRDPFATEHDHRRQRVVRTELRSSGDGQCTNSVRVACDGKTTCEYNIQPAALGPDPCVGTHKDFDYAEAEERAGTGGMSVEVAIRLQVLWSDRLITW
jgi:hypothetical protein